MNDVKKHNSSIGTGLPVGTSTTTKTPARLMAARKEANTLGVWLSKRPTKTPASRDNCTRHSNNADLFNSVTLATRNGLNSICDKMELIAGDKDQQYEHFTGMFRYSAPAKRSQIVKDFLKATNKDESGAEAFLVYVELAKQFDVLIKIDAAIPSMK